MEKETVILDFQIEQGDAISELQKTKRAIIELKEQQSALNKAYKDGDKSIDEYSKKSVELEQSLKKETATYNNLNKVVQTTSNSLEAQRLKLSQLVSERNKIDRSTVEGVKKFNDLNKSIKGLNDTIKESEQAGGDFRRNVGNYSSAVEDFAMNVNVGGSSLGDLTGKLTAFMNPATAAAGAVTALVGLYLSSAAGARDLESAQDQLSNSFKNVSNSLAELVGANGTGDGLLSRLAFGINRALFGLDAAFKGALVASANQALKQLELEQLNAQRVAKISLQEAEKLRRVRDDDTKSFEERKKAADDALGFINVREQVLVKTQEKRLTQLKILLSQDKNNLDLQKEIKQTEFEISDIREDSEGKRTELITGINGLLDSQIAKLNELSNIAFQADLKQVESENKKQEAYRKTIDELVKLISKVNEYNGVVDISSELAEQEAEDKKEADEANKQYDKSTQELTNSIQKEIDINQARLATFGQLASTIVLLAGKNKDLALAGIALERATAISQVVSSTGIANAKAVAATPLTFGQPFVGINSVSAALSIATILAQAAQSFGDVSAAAGGGKFMTRGPSLLMVGDNPGGVERVTVEPISGRGKTTVRGNMVAMAGGGVLETQSMTGPINQAFAFKSQNTQPIVYASWKEATELNNRVQFKEALVTI
jgi:hypothetical protein